MVAMQNSCLQTQIHYNIRTEGIYKDFWADKDKFDFSNYNKNSGFYDPTNKKVIGKMKD